MALTSAASRIPTPTAERWQLALAFLAIYVLWGSTYYAIRVLVTTIPPLLAAGLRFAAAGGALYGWSRWRGVQAPTQCESRNLAVLGVLMFLLPYGGLFWAEQSMPSGIAALLVSTIPIWTAAFEIVVFRKGRVTLALLIAFVLGTSGVALLAFTQGINGVLLWPCLAIVASEISWALGTVLTKVRQLPGSKLISAGGQMLAGGVFLLVASGLLGEWRQRMTFRSETWFALLYLIGAGSLIAFTAYIWLLGRMPATKVSSYAYVNPVVALVIGAWLGGEAFTPRIALGAGLVLCSVLLMLVRPKSSGKQAASD